MNKSVVSGLTTGVLAFVFGVCLSSAGKAQDAPAHDVKGLITAMSLDSLGLSNVYYQASDKVLQGVSALDIRYFDAKVCFKNYSEGDELPKGYERGAGLTINDIFGNNAKVGKKQTILQVVRIYSSDEAVEPMDCSTYEYAYSEVDAAPTTETPPEPAKKKKP